MSNNVAALRAVFDGVIHQRCHRTCECVLVAAQLGYMTIRFQLQVDTRVQPAWFIGVQNLFRQFQQINLIRFLDDQFHFLQEHQVVDMAGNRFYIRLNAGQNFVSIQVLVEV